MNGFAVHLHPVCKSPQNVQILLPEGTVGRGAEVQQQPAVLRGHVRQGLNQLRGGLVFRPSRLIRVAPGMPHDAGVALPQEGLRLRELTPFDVRYRHVEGECVMLVIDNAAAPFLRTVIIIRGKFPQIRFHALMLNPPVKVEDTGLHPVHQLAAAQQPVLQEFRGRCGFRCQILMVRRFLHGRPVQAVPRRRVAHVAVEFPSVGEKEPVLHPVAGNTPGQAFPFTGFQQITRDIAFRAHVHRIPLAQLAAVVLESVMMLRHGNHIIRAGFPEK